MSKIGIIIKREYLRRVSKKSFLLITLLTPFLMAALVFVPLWLSTIKSSDTKTVAIIDTTGKYGSLFEDTENYHFILTRKSLQDFRENPDKEIFAILNIQGDLLENPRAATLYSEKQIPQDLSGIVNRTLLRQIESDKLSTYDIPHLKEIIEDAKVKFNIHTIKWGTDGKEGASSSTVASITGMVFTLMIFMFIMIYGAMVMQGVTEEKSNRIIEVMISSVRPFDLMMGKIIGILLVGLTQVVLWGVILFSFTLAAQHLVGGQISPEAFQQGSMVTQQGIPVDMDIDQPTAELIQSLLTINWLEIVIFFVFFFIGGFFLYAAIFAAIGAAIDNQEDSQQFMTPVTLLMLFGFYAGLYSMHNPDGPLAFWCSMIPLTSPIVMMIRLPFDVPLWESLLSLFLLYATSIGIVWVSAKIYRVGILMYGKKPSIKEMIKWINYK
ncbi:MAG: ABC transporter permease [Tannerellaceae bacterium]|nr:ABC transporter permease [Tannerellaceae bacterium]